MSKSITPLASLWLLLSFMLAIHLYVAGTLALGVDEAHYGLYGIHLDWSYFDHPPMVGWLQALVLPFGTNEVLIRLLPALLWVISSVLLFRLTHRLFPQSSRWAGFVAVVLVSMGPLVQLLWFGMVPDVPLITLVVCLLFTIDKIEQTQGQSIKHWLMLGLLLGLCGLSKYTTVFVALALLATVIRHQRSQWFIQPGFWLAVIIGGVCISPVIYWNWQHDWLSFSYQFDHGAGGTWELKDSLRYVLVLIVSYGPLLTIAAMVAGFRSAKSLQRPSSMAATAMTYTAGLLLAFSIWSSGNGEVLPHWAVLSWVLLAPATAVWLCRHWENSRVRRWFTPLAVITVLLNVVFWWLLIAPPIKAYPVLREALKDLAGWREAASMAHDYWLEELEVEQSSNKQINSTGVKADNGGAQTTIWVRNWTHASRIAWYAQPAPVQIMTDGITQFHLWWGEAQSANVAILVELDKKFSITPKAFVWKGFECKPKSVYTHTVDTVDINRFNFYRCQRELKP